MNSGKPTSEAFGAGAGRERQGQPESKLHRERLIALAGPARSSRERNPV
jgi:hypothetical protein